MTFRKERKFRREMRKREQQLCRLEKSVIVIHHESEPLPDIPTEWPERGGGGSIWQCTFCNRQFFSYPALLTHKCDEEI